MKVTHLITTIELGGAEKQLLILTENQVRLGYEVRVVYLKGNPHLGNSFQKIGVKVEHSIANKPIFIQAFKLHRLFIEDCDLIHAHLPAAELLAAVLRSRIPLIVTRHNTQRFLEKRIYISRLLARFVEWRSSKCIAISEAVKLFLIENSEWRNTFNLVTVHYGVQAILPIPQNRTTIGSALKFLTISRLVSQKDLDTLLNAFALHHQSFPTDTLTIVGSGNEEERLRRLAKSLGIHTAVQWYSDVHDVETVYINHDVFVLTSKYEGFGLVLLEAMSYGKPILAANNTAIPEVLGSQYSGLFRTGDFENLAYLLSKTHEFEFIRELRSMCDERLSFFSAETMAGKINAIYMEVFEN